MVLVALELAPTKLAGSIGRHRHWQASPQEQSELAQSELVQPEHRPSQMMQERQRPNCWLLLLVPLCPTRLAIGRPALVLTMLQGLQQVYLLRSVIGHRPIPLL